MCTTAHPAGCAANVHDAVARVKARAWPSAGPRRVLVIGASTGYGLAAAITAAFGCGAATLGVFLDKPARRRKPASAGWYNMAAFSREADAEGLVHLALCGDAFADATRDRTIALIHERLGGPVDLVVYSLAAPARRLHGDGELVQTAIAPVGPAFRGMTIDPDDDHLVPVELAPATTRQIDDTIAVMGGGNWVDWINALRDAGALTDDARTVAFSYVGPELTWPIYRHGTIGRAKADLERCAGKLNAITGRDDFARIAVLKSNVTQASAVIPVIPLYLATMMRVLRERGLEEDTLDQQCRLFADFLLRDRAAPVDAQGRWRLDDRELDAAAQARCLELLATVNDDNLVDITDYVRYKKAFLNLFGFARDDIDYALDVDADVDFHPETVT